MTMMNADDADRSQQKRQRESHVVAVVHRAEQDREYDHGEDNPGSGRQDVDSSAGEPTVQRIGTLTAARPVLCPLTEYPAQALLDGVQGTGTDSSTRAAISGSG